MIDSAAVGAPETLVVLGKKADEPQDHAPGQRLGRPEHQYPYAVRCQWASLKFLLAGEQLYDNAQAWRIIDEEETPSKHARSRKCRRRLLWTKFMTLKRCVATPPGIGSIPLFPLRSMKRKIRAGFPGFFNRPGARGAISSVIYLAG